MVNDLIIKYSDYSADGIPVCKDIVVKTSAKSKVSLYYNCASSGEYQPTPSVSDTSYVFDNSEGDSAVFAGNNSDVEVSSMNDMFAVTENGEYNADIEEVTFNKAYNPINMIYAFSHSPVRKIDFGNLVISRLQNANYCFDGCRNLEEIDLSSKVLSSVQYLNCAFRNCSSLKRVVIPSVKPLWISELFKGCSSIESIDMSSFDLSTATQTTNIFEGCRMLTGVNWGTTTIYKSTSMAFMFKGCESLKSIDMKQIKATNDGRSVQITGMFEDCRSLKSIDWDNAAFTASAVHRMFKNCNMLTSIDLSGISTTQLGSIDEMFYHCYNIEEIDISNFEISSTCTYSNAFADCASLNRVKVANCNTTTKNRLIQALSVVGTFVIDGGYLVKS